METVDMAPLDALFSRMEARWREARAAQDATGMATEDGEDYDGYDEEGNGGSASSAGFQKNETSSDDRPLCTVIKNQRVSPESVQGVESKE